MNCREIIIAAKFNGATIGWERKINPVTWETLKHSISIAAGLAEYEKDFTKNLNEKLQLMARLPLSWILT